MWWNIFATLFLLPGLVTPQRDCSRSEYDRCVRIADPLVKEAHLVFPDNLNDIDLVCRTWNKFVDCLRAYTEICFNDQQRQEFNRAVKSPIDSVHQMCMQPSYQKEYLHHAPCIKSTVVERDHCGLHYNLLVDQVEQGEVISKSTLCCSHERFKQCVLKETRRSCDHGVSEGPATRFASQIIDKALKFLQDQCINYIPNSGDCKSNVDSVISYSDRSDPSSVISTAASEGWGSTTHRQDYDGNQMYPSRSPKVSTSGWIGSSAPPGMLSDSTTGSVPPTQYLGRRTRPLTYGRSNSWKPDLVSRSTDPPTSPMMSTPSSVQQNIETQESGWKVGAELNRPDVSASSSSYRTTPSSTPKFDSSSSSSLWNPASMSTTETWYPAAGNQLTNEVDEPNQLGWQKPRNLGNSPKSFSTVTAIVVLNMCRTWLA